MFLQSTSSVRSSVLVGAKSAHPCAPPCLQDDCLVWPEEGPCRPCEKQKPMNYFITSTTPITSYTVRTLTCFRTYHLPVRFVDFAWIRLRCWEEGDTSLKQDAGNTRHRDTYGQKTGPYFCCCAGCTCPHPASRSVVARSDPRRQTTGGTISGLPPHLCG